MAAASVTDPRKPVDVVLASAPLSLATRYGRLQGAGNTLPALGLLYLAGAARRAGHRVAVLDADARGMDEVDASAAILARSPSVVGLSATTLGIASAARLAARLRQAAPSLRIVIGGPHATALPEDTLRRFTAFDALVQGEGELTLVDLLDAWQGARSLEHVAGITWRTPDGIRVNESRARVEDLDSLARPAWDLLDGFPRRFAPPVFRFRKLPAASLVTSRGCPFECSFCDRSIFGRKVRFHSVGVLLDLIGELWDRGVREILFEDDTFTANRERIGRFCEEVATRFPRLSWSCLARATSVNPSMLHALKAAGCWQISFGIESGDPEVLRRMMKKIELEQIRAAVEGTRAAGIQSKGFFILGYPGETRESMDRTLAFALSLPLDDVSVSMFTPFPGSPIYAETTNLGRFDEDWERMSLLNAVFVPKGLRRGDIEHAHARFLRRFYLRPTVVCDYVRRLASNPRAAPAYLNALAAFARSTASAPRAG
jgi:radical SAM superfamily enzyme YgiQ (UPF0313 family)